MEFKKLALAAAVASLPATGFSMEALEDSALSGVTGQDGISIALNTNLSAELIIHDTDGIGDFSFRTVTTTTTTTTTGPGTITNQNVNVNTGTNSSYGNAAALVMSDFAIDTGGNEITLDIDAGDSAGTGTAPTLNIQVGIPSNTSITLGSVDIANSNRDAGSATESANWGVDATNRVDDVLNLGTITLGATSMNIQLANEPQGDMIALNTTITNGISIDNFAINDANSGGGIGVGTVSIVGNGASDDLSVAAGVNVASNGLVIRVDELGASGADVRLTGVSLGDQSTGNTTPALGDIELVGLQLSGTTVRISGK
jgi:hypothetical protein